MPICLEKHGQNSAETAPFCAAKAQHGGVSARKSGHAKAARFDNYPSNVHMRASLKRLRMSAARFSDLIGKPGRTVKEWSRGAARPSQEAMTILSMIEGLPGAREWLEARNPREMKPRGRPFKSRWGRRV
jgi:DNA-binding transcriptional regulator YiaG